MNQESKIRLKGTIISIDKGRASVRVEKPAECEECGACLTGMDNVIKMPARAELKAGDNVWLTIECSVIAKISFLLYFIPAVCAVIGFVAGYFTAGDTGGFAGAVLMLIIGYFVIKKTAGDRYSHTTGIEKIKE